MQTVATGLQSESSQSSNSFQSQSFGAAGASRQPTRRALIFLFLTLLAIYAYATPRWNDWNQNSRLSLVRAIVEQGTLRVDTYQSSTGDYAYYQGHYYSDKPPGPALAGVLPYAALKAALSSPPLASLITQISQSPSFNATFTEGTNYGQSDSTPRDKLIGAMGRILMTVVVICIPTAFMLCLFWKWCCQITGRYWLSLSLTLALAFGTTLFTYSTLFYNHALSATLLFISFYLLHRLKPAKGPKSWLAVCGFLLGFSLISQYESALIALLLGLYALATVSRTYWWHRILWLGVGALPALLALVVYDLLAFGTPLPIGYQYSTLWLDKHSQGFMSLTYPHVEALWGLSFSPYRGLFFLSPFLLLALPGFYFGLRRKDYRSEAALALWSGVAFFLFNASSVMWWGGHAFGPRYLVTCLPFVAFGVALLLREATIRQWRGVALWFGLPVLLSVALVLPASLAGRQWPSEEFSNPLTDYLWPQLLSGNLALNLGRAIGLNGIFSYLPLIAGLGLLYGLMFLWPRRKTSPLVSSKLPGEIQRFHSTAPAGKMEVVTTVPESPTKANTAHWWRRDWFFVAAVTVAMLLFTSLPYLFGYLKATQTKVFIGIMLDVPDTTQYWAWMREMQQSWLIANPLTSEPNDPIFFNLLWGILAQMQLVTGWEQSLIYQLFRVGSIIFYGWLVWCFCKFLFARPLAQRTAFLLIMFGSGWGWISILIKQFTGTLANPLTVFLAEPNSFQSALAFPHLIFSVGLILAIFLLAFRAAESGQLKWAWAAAAIALVLGLEHAYDLLIIYSVLGCYWLLKMARLRRFDLSWFKILLIIGLVSLPPPLYFVYLTTVTPTWKGVLAQYGNAGVFTPDPFNLLILMGPLLLLAIVGLWTTFRPIQLTKPQSENSRTPDPRQERLLLLAVWFVVGFFLIYIPTNFQIKMFSGWQISIFGMAVVAIFGPVPSWIGKLKLPKIKLFKIQTELVLCLLLLLLALPTTFYIFSWRFLDLNRTAQPYYLERDEIAAINWLGTRTPPNIVLSSQELGQYMAACTANRPFLAHWAMTLDFYTKRKLSAEVLDARTAPERRAAILAQYQVKFILYGAVEKQLVPELTDPGLRKVFSTPKADVYQVINSAGGLS